ncbi:MAG TPA: acylneuraminate cytidylyltransferase family protein [Myxococcota bacterium]
MTADVVAIVPARGGSKGIPRKNITPVGGRPLIAWSIEAARAAQCVRRVIVSTDDDEIAAVARASGAEVPFMRPAALAADGSAGIDPILHAVEALGLDNGWICVLQPTSPLRLAADIDGARALAEERDADGVLGVTAVRQHAAWHKGVDADGWCVTPTTPPATRQALPSSWCPNGAIYLVKTAVLRAERTLLPRWTALWEMPASRSIDVDVPDDLAIVAALLGARHER